MATANGLTPRFRHFVDLFFLFVADTQLPVVATSAKNHQITAVEASTSTAATTTVSDQPIDQSVELSFEENREQKTFLFAQDNTFIQLDGDPIQTFQLRWICRAAEKGWERRGKGQSDLVAWRQASPNFKALRRVCVLLAGRYRDRCLCVCVCCVCGTPGESISLRTSTLPVISVG